MPSIPKQTQDIKNMQSADIINTVRDQIGGDFKENTPTVYATGSPLEGGEGRASKEVALASYANFWNALSNNNSYRNNFIAALVNRIAQVLITSRLYRNPWAELKKGYLEYGESVEEIFVNMAKPYQFDPEKSEKRVFERRLPDVASAFHTMNYQKFYPITVSYQELKQAFLSESGVTDLISRIIEQVYTGANYDEFQAMKYVVARAALSGYMYPIVVPPITEDNSRTVTTKMVAAAKDMGYMSTQYNISGVSTYTDISYLYMILNTETSSIFDVNVLALSFNMDKAELLGRQIGVDGFGKFDMERLELLFEGSPIPFVPFTPEEIAQLEKIAGVMIDRSFLMIFDNLDVMDDIKNPEGLYWNYFYHVWKIFSISPFSNAIVFTSAQPTLTSVAINPATITLPKGSTYQLKADVVVDGFASAGVTWTMTGQAADSYVDRTGLVRISKNETSSTITVTATSRYDNTKSGRCTITVTGV